MDLIMGLRVLFKPEMCVFIYVLRKYFSIIVPRLLVLHWLFLVCFVSTISKGVDARGSYLLLYSIALEPFCIQPSSCGYNFFFKTKHLKSSYKSN